MIYIVSDEDVNVPGVVNMLVKKMTDRFGNTYYDVAKKNQQMSHDKFIEDGYILVRCLFEYYKNPIIRELSTLKKKYLF